jgi:cytochrome c-type biogenesis protein CcsB
VSVNENLAGYSNPLLYSSMAVYAGAMGAFAIDLAVSGRQAVAASSVAAAKVRDRVLVGARASVDDAGATESSVGGSGSAASTTDGGLGPRRAVGIAMSLTWLAFLLHGGAVLTRGLAVDRPPWGNMYEFACAGSAVVTLVFLIACTRKDLRYLGLFITAPVLLTLGLAVSVLYTSAGQLVPALKSYWLAIHVTVAFIASALFVLAFSATVLYLVQASRERRKALGQKVGANFMDALPSAAEIDRAAYRLHAIAFPLWMFTIVAGAIWAESAWGHYWSWDPKEVWSFVIWVIYAGYLHARATRGWGPRKASYIAMVGFAALLFNFLVVNIWIVGLHSYAGVS